MRTTRYNDNRNRNDVQRWRRARARRTRCIEKPLCDVRPRCARASVACRDSVSIFFSRERARVLTGRWPIAIVSCQRRRRRSRTVVHAIHACVISCTARARGHRSTLVARASEVGSADAPMRNRLSRLRFRVRSSTMRRCERRRGRSKTCA